MSCHASFEALASKIEECTVDLKRPCRNLFVWWFDPVQNITLMGRAALMCMISAEMMHDFDVELVHGLCAECCMGSAMQAAL